MLIIPHPMFDFTHSTRRWAGCMAGAAVLSMGTMASAAMTLETGYPKYSADESGNKVKWYINAAQCKANEAKLSFKLNGLKENTGSVHMFVSADGTDCSTSENRKDTEKDCTLVQSVKVESATSTVEVKVGELAGKVTSDCKHDGADFKALSLYFIQATEENGDPIESNTLAWTGKELTLDFVPPDAPEDVEANTSNEAISVSFTVDGRLSTDVGTEGEYVFFCEDLGAVPGASEGECSASDALDHASGDAGCSGTTLKEGEAGPEALSCGSTEDTDGTTDAFDNCNQIAVAVAAKDEAGNIGVLSNVACGVPLATEGFWERYDSAGGQVKTCQVGRVGTGELAWGWALGLVGGAWMRRARQRGRLLVAWVPALIATVANSAAAGEDIPVNDWRQDDRSLHYDKHQSEQAFALEFRFGSYKPLVDEEFAERGSKATPYQDVFGDGGNFYIGTEFDWLPLRVPYVGVVGLGVGFGYTSASASAGLAGTNFSSRSDEETSLKILPMYADAVLRMDGPLQHWGIPVVPYAKFGVGLGHWWSDGNGKGITTGLHYAFGGMLCLNGLDRRAAASLDQSMGINHTYLFGEYYRLDLDGFGSDTVMHIGAETFAVGLAMDF